MLATLGGAGLGLLLLSELFRTTPKSVSRPADATTGQAFPTPPPTATPTGSENIAKARQLLKNGTWATASQVLDRVAKSDPAFKDVAPLRAEVRRAKAEAERAAAHAEKKRREDDAAARGVYAALVERAALKLGVDAHVRAVGPSKTTLRYEWILMSRPVAYRHMDDKDFVEATRAAGFKSMIFTDGNESWGWDLK